MKLTAENVEKVFLDCLYSDEEAAKLGEPPDDAIVVEGILARYGFKPDSIDKHSDTIVNFLHQLHDKFKIGWSFLNACVDKEGNLWGEHRNVEQLVVLGLAIDKVQYCAPREIWKVMPGGLPYFIVK